MRLPKKLQNNLGGLVGYKPQMLGKITARDVNSDPKYATLRQIIFKTLTNPDAAKYYIKNKGQGMWTATAVYIDPNGENHKWAEHVKLSGRYDEQPKKSDGGKLVVAKSGWGKTVKDGKYKGKPYYVLWDLRENGGFVRETTDDKDEARALAKEAGFDPRLVSYQTIDIDYKGWYPVVCYSDSGNGPAYVFTGWNFDYFDLQFSVLGCLFSNGFKKIAE